MKDLCDIFYTNSKGPGFCSGKVSSHIADVKFNPEGRIVTMGEEKEKNVVKEIKVRKGKRRK